MTRRSRIASWIVALIGAVSLATTAIAADEPGSGSATPPPPVQQVPPVQPPAPPAAQPPPPPALPNPPTTADGRPFTQIVARPRPGWNQGNIVNACRNTPGLPEMTTDMCLAYYGNAGRPFAQQINIGHVVPWNQFVTQAGLMGYYQNPDVALNTYYQAAANVRPPGTPGTSQNPGSGLNNTFMQSAPANQAAGALYDGPSINNPAVIEVINQQVALGNGTFGQPYGPLVEHLNQVIAANPGMDYYIVHTEQGPMVFNDLGQPAEYNFQPRPWWNPNVPGSLGFVVPAQMITGAIAQDQFGTPGTIVNNTAWGLGTGYYYFGGTVGGTLGGGFIALGATGGGIGGAYVGGQIELALGGDGSIGAPIGSIAGAGAGAGLTAGVVYGTGMSTLGFAAGTTTGTVIASTGGTVILIAGTAYVGYQVGTALAPYVSEPIADAYIDWAYGDQNRFNATGLPNPTGNEQFGPGAAGHVGACGTSYQQALCSQNCRSFGQNSSNCRCCTACQSYACGM
jgi:hypothetical protein